MKTRGNSREILFRLGALAALPLLVASCGGGGGGGAKTVIVSKCDKDIGCTLKYEPEKKSGGKALMFELSIPAGALEESAEISIEESDGSDKSLSFMPTYKILPETLRFATGKKAGLVLGYVYDKDDKDNPLPDNLEEGGLRIGKRNSAGGFDLQKDSGPPRLDVDQISGEVTGPGEYAVVYNPLIFSVTPEVGKSSNKGTTDGTPIIVTGINFKTDFKSIDVMFNKIPVADPETNIKFAENEGNAQFTVVVPELGDKKEEDLKGAFTITITSGIGKKRTSNAVNWGFGTGFDAAVYDPSISWGKSAILEKCTDANCFVQPWGIAIDQFDCIYVTDAGGHQLKKFTSSGGLAGTSASCPAFKGDVSQVGKLGKGDTTKAGEAPEFNTPRGVAVDASGNIYVADSLNHRVVMLDNTGMLVKAYGTRGTGVNEKKEAVEGQLDQPAGLTLDPDGDVVVVDSLNNRLIKFDPIMDKPADAAKQSGIIGPTLSDALGTLKLAQEPAGIALDKSASPARLYVVDPGNWRIVYFDRKETKDEKGVVVSATYELKDAFGSQAKSGEGKDEKFVRPTGVTVDVRGTVYVVDNQGPRIQKFDKTLKALPTEVGNPKDRTQIGEPTSAVVDSKAGIFVVDRTLSKVQKFAPR